MECQPIECTVNGEPRAIHAGQTLLHLLAELQLNPERVAIELDRRIIKRPEWEACRIAAGARIEIVQFVGGG